MRTVPDTSQPISHSHQHSSDSDFDPAVEWEDSLQPVLPEKNQSLSSDKLIRIANSKLSLRGVLKHYHINIPREQSSTGWASHISCPFQDHRDSTPSFGYNYTEDKFYCFGCSRGGGSVQFISLIENKPAIGIANEILEQYGFDILEENLVEDNQSQEIEELLLGFSHFLRNFIQKAEQKIEAMTLVEKVSWSVDLYLSKHLADGNVDLEGLRARVQKLEEYLIPKLK